MNKIIPLENIAVSLEEAQQLNNSQPSALAWVWNPHKNISEFELIPVEKIESDKNVTAQLNITIDKDSGKWQMWQTEVFVSIEQIEELIKNGHFYYAPLKIQ